MQVVRLGAWCDVSEFTWRMRAEGRPIRTLSVEVHEYAVLDDGRRLTLHRDKGWNGAISVMGDEDGTVSRDPWDHLTEDEIRRDVLTSVTGAMPDEGAEPLVDHPYEWLAELLTRQDVHATPEELRGVPYDVELGPHLVSHFRGTRPKSTLS